MGVCERLKPAKSNDQLGDEITLLAGQINAACYSFLKLIAEFDNRDAWAAGGIRSCGINLGSAREKIRVAHCLESLPKINVAFSLGEISYSKVRAMTRVATDDNEDFLLMIAQHGTASHMEQKDVSAETFSEQTSSDNVVSLEFPYANKRAAALITMAEHYLASATNAEGVKSLAGSERCQIMLHVDINTLQSQPSDNKYCNIDNKHWISPETAKRLSCDASLVTVLEDDKGNVLNIGRRSRTIPPAIQRALSLRDATCRHPGCCTSNYLDAHHIQHWADGGETSLDNLLMLCRHHHRGLHKGEFSISVENAAVVFTTAKGKRLEPSIYPQFPQNVTPNFDNVFPLINKNTAVTQWRGEVMDFGMAVDGLLYKDNHT